MMTLNEFLQTASADHATALTEAKAATMVVGNYAATSTVNSLLAQIGLRVKIKQIAATDGHPFQDAADAFIDSTMSSGNQFNFIAGTPAGDAQLGMLDAMIEAPDAVIDAATKSKLSTFKAELTTRADVKIVPRFPDVTLHQVLLIRDAMPAPVPITRTGNFARMRVTAVCEKHNPRLLGQTPSGKWQRINNFMGVSEAGDYDCLVPPQWLGQPLAVDNAYGVVEAI